MTIKVRGFCGIESKDVDLTKKRMTAVIGANGSGKTSLLNAVRIALGVDINPLGLSSNLMRYYNNSTTEAAIECDWFMYQSKWTPSGGQKATGGAFFTNERQKMGCTHTDFTVRLTPKENHKRWMTAMPALEDLGGFKEALIGSGCSEEEANDITTQVQKQGWDAALADVQARGRHWKTTWQQLVTAHEAAPATYGEKRAKDYIPTGWSDALRGVVLKDHTAEMEKTREEAREVQSDRKTNDQIQAVVDGIQQAMNSLQDPDQLLKEQQAIQKQIEELDTNTKIDKLKAEYAQRGEKPGPEIEHETTRLLDEMIADTKQMDWHKGFMDYLESKYKYSAWQAYYADEDKYKAIEQKVRDITGKAQQLDAQLHRNAQEIKSIQQQREKLQAKLDEAKGEAPADEHMQRLQVELEQKADRLLKECKAIEVHEKAHAAHNEVMRNKKILSLLDPKGYRAKVQEKYRDILNKTLGLFQEIWGQVFLDDAFNLLYEGQPITVCSSSERWRANQIVHLALAILNKAPVVLMDDAEVMDEANLSKLPDLLDIIDEDIRIIVASAHMPERVTTYKTGVQVVDMND